MYRKFFASVVILLLLSSLSWAETFLVTNNNSEGLGSFAEAVNSANTSLGLANIIEFDPAVKSLTLPRELTIFNNVYINGHGVSLTAATGTRLFTVSDGVVVFDSITFKGGKVTADDGGAVKITGPDSDVDFVNCTFYGNEAEDYGGAICVTNGKTELFFCTVAGNKAGNGGLAVRNGEMNVYASIVLGNTSGDVYKSNAGTLAGSENIFGTGNYINFGTGNAFGQKLSDILVTDSSGSPVTEIVDGVEVIKITGTSIARDYVDSGNTYDTETDETGTPRPQLNYPDAGAYESMPVAVESIFIASYPYMQINSVETLSVEIYPLDASLNTRDYPSNGIEWRTDDSSVIYFDEDGKAHAAGIGSTYITAYVHGWDSLGNEISRASDAIAVTVGTEARRPLRASIYPIDDFSLPVDTYTDFTPEVFIDMNDIIIEDAAYSLNVSSSANHIVTAEIISGNSVRLSAGSELGEATITLEARPYPNGDSTRISFAVEVVYHSVPRSSGGGGCNTGIFAGALILCAYLFKNGRGRK